MNKRPSNTASQSAPTQGYSSTNQLPLFSNADCPTVGKFQGTNNPRLLRIIDALTASSISRERLDSVAGCSNGPEHISQLRLRGLEIPCENMPCIDRDGRPSHFGLYRLTDNDRLLIEAWKAEVANGG